MKLILSVFGKKKKEYWGVHFFTWVKNDGLNVVIKNWLNILLMFYENLVYKSNLYFMIHIDT